MKSGHFDLSVPNEACRRRNPQVFTSPAGTLVTAESKRPAKRIRQDKPMNKLEEAYGHELERQGRGRQYPQAITLKLANGLRYTPDWAIPSERLFVEVKGKHAWDDSIAKLKSAAHEHPWATFWLVWRDEHTGAWQTQVILP